MSLLNTLAEFATIIPTDERISKEIDLQSMTLQNIIKENDSSSLQRLISSSQFNNHETRVTDY